VGGTDGQNDGGEIHLFRVDYRIFVKRISYVEKYRMLKLKLPPRSSELAILNDPYEE
jgi:hypothetical protein